MDGDFTDTGGCLRALDVDVSLTDVDVSRPQGDEFPDSHACVNKDERISYPWDIHRPPETSYLPGCEWLFMVDDGVLRQLDEWAQIVVHDAVFDGVFIHLTQ